MKAYKAILKDIEKNAKQIEAMTAEIIELDYSKARAEVAKSGHFTEEAKAKFKELREKAEANADKIRKLSADIYTAEIKERILKANARTALLSEAMPIILEACRPYNGKPYGERTAEKIREEVRKAGYSFYFNSREEYKIEVYTLTKEGYRSHADGATGTATDETGKYYSKFLTDDNRLNIENVTVKPYRDKYTENPTKEAKRISKAIHEYTESTKAMERKRRELCDMLPDGIPTPEYIKEYSVNFWR